MHGAEGENPLVGIGQFAQAWVEQRLLAEGLFGQQVLAALGELDLDILHGQLDDPLHQQATGAGSSASTAAISWRSPSTLLQNADSASALRSTKRAKVSVMRSSMSLK